MKQLHTFESFVGSLNEAAADSINIVKKAGLTKFAKEELGINESIGFKVMDFPIGAEVYMGDEVWKVVKPGVKGEKIIMAPFNAEAKRKYISIAIEFDLKWLDGNVTEIDI